MAHTERTTERHETTRIRDPLSIVLASNEPGLGPGFQKERKCVLREILKSLPNPLKAIPVLWLLCSLQAEAQPPATDIYLLTLNRQDGRILPTEPVNITDRDGYDNQPAFLPDGSGLLYTSIRADGQADTYRYNLGEGSITRLTRTPESEYSPTPMAGGRFFSVVRVEADSTQRLWRFPLQGGEPNVLLEHIQPVGYHAWADSVTVALFVLGDPPTLQLADLRTGRAKKMADGIGRSLQKIPGSRAISFVHKVVEKEWWVKRLDVDSGTVTALIQTLPGSEDHSWTPDGVLLMGKGSKLYQWDPPVDEGWREIADLASAGIQGTSRLAVSPKGDRIAVVGGR